MVTAEQQTITKEQTQPASVTEQPGKVSEEKGQTSSDFKKTPEYQKDLQTEAYRLAQSLKDKEINPLRDRIKRFEEQQAEREVEDELRKQEEAESKQFEGEGVEKKDVKTFQEGKRQLSKDKAQFGKEVVGMAESIEESNARSYLLQYALPQSDEFEKTLEEAIKEIREKSNDDVSLKMAAQLKAPFLREQLQGLIGKTEIKSPRIPTGVATASGGVDWRKQNLSPRQLIKMGIEKQEQNKK